MPSAREIFLRLQNKRLKNALTLLRSREFISFFTKSFSFALKILFKKQVALPYEQWRKNWVELDQKDRDYIASKISQIKSSQTFAFFMNIESSSKDLIEESIESLNSQLYSNWHLYLCVNAENRKLAKSILKNTDNRVSIFIYTSSDGLPSNISFII